MHFVHTSLDSSEQQCPKELRMPPVPSQAFPQLPYNLKLRSLNYKDGGQVMGSTLDCNIWNNHCYCKVSNHSVFEYWSLWISL